MAKKDKTGPGMPGDLVQIISPGHAFRKAVAIVKERHGWGLGVTLQAIQNDKLVERYERLKAADYVVVGTLQIMEAEVYHARRAALDTAAELAREVKA